MCENIENSLQSRSRVFKTLYRAIKKIVQVFLMKCLVSMSCTCKTFPNPQSKHHIEEDHGGHLPLWRRICFGHLQ